MDSVIIGDDKGQSCWLKLIILIQGWIKFANQFFQHLFVSKRAIFMGIVFKTSHIVFIYMTTNYV